MIDQPPSGSARLIDSHCHLNADRFAGEEAKVGRTTKSFVFRLVLRGGKWKIAAPQNEPHVSPETAMKLVENMESNTLYQADPDHVRASKEAIRRIMSGG